MAINHGNAGVAGAADLGGAIGAPAAAPAALPPRRRIDELGDAWTGTPQEQLNVDMGAPEGADQGVVLPNTGEINDEKPPATDPDGNPLVEPNANDAAPPPELPAELAEIKAKWESPELAPELDDRLVLVGPDDAPEHVTVSELKRSFLRNQDYSQKTMAVADMRRRYESGLAGQNRLVEQLSGAPEQFLAAIDDLAAFEPKVALAFEAAVQHQVEQEIKDFERVGKNHELLAEVKEGRRAKRERDRALREAETYRDAQRKEAEQRAQANRPDVQALVRQLDQLVPRALKEIGLVDMAQVRQAIGPELGVFWQDRTKPLTYAQVRDAAMSVKQKFTKQFGAEALKPRAAPQVATPQQAARTPAAAPQGGGKPQRKRIDELGGDWYER